MITKKNNLEKALRLYNRAIVLLPNEENLLAMRSLCNYRLGNKMDAQKDWARLNKISKINGTDISIENLAEFSANPQMVKTISK